MVAYARVALRAFLLRAPLVGLLAVGFIGLFMSTSLVAQAGRDIALKWDAVDNSQSSSFKATMTIKRGGQSLVRTMDIKRQKDPNSEKQLIVFLEPPDTRGTSYLTWAYRDHQKDDDMWVFLPAESLTRRIAGGARKGPFARGDYALEDIFRREVDEDNWELLGEVNLAGADCHALKATPLDSKATGYSKRLLWIRKDINLPTKVEYYGPKDKLLKTLVLGDFKNIQGIWLPLRQRMAAQGTDSVTTLDLTEVVFNQTFPADLFLSQNLKR
ncbi:MAG: outer membrane lipoprotein-sorting protein [Deltaproteobacteria bacterium]|jgi:outer membrane lipoprotein-sorting protein|nr:outer membrane lipoprotein-sorting protein [Deltaproteobacteria bacterium]